MLVYLKGRDLDRLVDNAIIIYLQRAARVCLKEELARSGETMFIKWKRKSALQQ